MEQSQQRLESGDDPGADDQLASGRVDWTRGRRQAHDELGGHANHNYVPHGFGGWHDSRVRWRPRHIFHFDGAQPRVLYPRRLAADDDAFASGNSDASANQRLGAKGRDPADTGSANTSAFRIVASR